MSPILIGEEQFLEPGCTLAQAPPGIHTRHLSFPSNRRQENAPSVGMNDDGQRFSDNYGPGGSRPLEGRSGASRNGDPWELTSCGRFSSACHGPLWAPRLNFLQEPCEFRRSMVICAWFRVTVLKFLGQGSVEWKDLEAGIRLVK